MAAWEWGMGDGGGWVRGWAAMSHYLPNSMLLNHSFAHKDC